MVRGAFRVWENILVSAGGLLALLFKVLEELADLEISIKPVLVCFIIMSAALFSRPVWLAVNWRRLSVHEPFSGIISSSDLNSVQKRI